MKITGIVGQASLMVMTINHEFVEDLLSPLEMTPIMYYTKIIAGKYY